MKHYNIKKFTIDGIAIDGTKFERIKEDQARLLVQMMREQGYVPVLELGPMWNTKYDGKKFDYIVSVYGIYVGRNKACEIEGMTSEGKLVPRTPKNK